MNDKKVPMTTDPFTGQPPPPLIISHSLDEFVVGDDGRLVFRGGDAPQLGDGRCKIEPTWTCRNHCPGLEPVYPLDVLKCEVCGRAR